MNEKQAFVDGLSEKCTDNKMDFAFEIREADTKRFFYQDLKEIVNIFCNFSFKVFYVCYGILQFFAIWDGLLNISHHNSIIMLLISLGLAFVPGLGTCLGIWGAYTSWEWNLFHAVFIFIIPYLVVCVPLLMVSLFETYNDIKRWRGGK